MRSLVALLVSILATSAPIAAQRTEHVAVDFGAGAIRISFDPAVAHNSARIDALLGARAGWPLGGRPGALLATTVRYRFDQLPVPPGLYAVGIQHDTYATWLLLSPLETIDRPRPGATPIRVPLLEEPRDSVADSLDVTIDAGRGSSETIVFTYDKQHEATIDRYTISTEPNRPVRRLVIDWGRRRWTVPITVPDP